MLNNPVVIVTGASRGLGAAIVRHLAQMGAGVVLAARSTELIEEETQKICDAGGSALYVTADVSLEADCGRIVHQALDQFGRIDALVNNAGMVEPMGPVAQASAQDWQRNWAVNVLGPVMLARMTLPSLRERRGRIINLSSGAAVNVVPGWGAYSTAKAALNHLTTILAAEEPAVTSLSVRPGIVDTEMQANIRDKGKGRMGESNYNRLYGLYEKGQLLPPDQPGKAIAVLALHAPYEWSGQTIQWDDAQVEQLAKSFPS